jgi:hypothetical protein
VKLFPPGLLVFGAPSGSQNGSAPSAIPSLADADDRPPHVETVFVIPGFDPGVRHRDVDKREQAQVLRQPLRLGLPLALFGKDRLHDLVVQSGRRADLRCAVVGPVDADYGLAGRAAPAAASALAHDLRVMAGVDLICFIQ